MTIQMKELHRPTTRNKAGDRATHVGFDLDYPLPPGTCITFALRGWVLQVAVERSQEKARYIEFQIKLEEDMFTGDAHPVHNGLKKPVFTGERDGFKYTNLVMRVASASTPTSTSALSAPPAPPAPPSGPPAVVKKEQLTDAEVVEVKRRLCKMPEETRLENIKTDPAYPARLSGSFSNPSPTVNGKRVARPVPRDAGESTSAATPRGENNDSVARTEHDDVKAELAKIRKLCHAVGIDKVIDAALADPNNATELLKTTKDCMALIHRHGGADFCTRELKMVKEVHKAKYAYILAANGLQPREIVKIKVPGTTFYTMGMVSQNPDPEFPTAPCISTLFVNDGAVFTDSTMSLAVGGGIGSIEKCINNQEMEKHLNAVFEISNLIKLHASALASKYTMLTNKYLYMYRLWKCTMKAILDRSPEKRNFLALYTDKVKHAMSPHDPNAQQPWQQRYANAFAGPSAPSAPSSSSVAAASSSSSPANVVEIPDD